MIISKNQQAPKNALEPLLNQTVNYFNQKALESPSYFKTREGKKLEKDTFEALKHYSIGTEFEGKLGLISGIKFPDIVANGYYGVEVKTTNSKTWKSTGNSVLESSRIEGIERIYILFGKLGDHSEFKFRAYEECLYEVAVTHSPRYLVNMETPIGETIFDKIGMDYNSIRKLENPIKPIVDHYRKSLKNGEDIWWLGSNKSDSANNLVIRSWGNLTIDQKDEIRLRVFCLFPEIFSKTSNKYNRVAPWLVAKYSVVSPSLRDSFSAGGKYKFNYKDKSIYLPKVYEHLVDNIKSIIKIILNEEEEILINYWKVNDISNRLNLWKNLLLKNMSEVLTKEDIGIVDDFLSDALK